MNQMIEIFGLVFAGSMLALSGGIIMLMNKKWAKWLSSVSIPFAAGVLLTVSLVGVLPTAVNMLGEQAYYIALFTFLVAFVFEHGLFGLHHHDEHHHGDLGGGSVALVILGDSIHNFADGVALAAAYMANPGLGVITAISTFLHEAPHEIGDFGILLRAGWKNKDIIIVNVLSALLSFVGAYFVLTFSENPTFIGTLIGISAGLFLYLGASDFLPHIGESKNDQKGMSMGALFLGVAIMLATFVFVPHEHAHGGHDHENHAEEEVHEEFDHSDLMEESSNQQLHDDTESDGDMHDEEVR